MTLFRPVIVVALFLWVGIAAAANVDLAIRQRFEQVQRLAQQMVAHGRHGHTAEIAKYADEMIQQTEPLVVVAGKMQTPAVRSRKERAMIQAALQSAIEEATAAARLGEARNPRAAMAAARRAAFQIKRARVAWEKAQ